MSTEAQSFRSRVKHRRNALFWMSMPWVAGMIAGVATSGAAMVATLIFSATGVAMFVVLCSARAKLIHTDAPILSRPVLPLIGRWIAIICGLLNCIHGVIIVDIVDVWGLPFAVAGAGLALLGVIAKEPGATNKQSG